MINCDFSGHNIFLAGPVFGFKRDELGDRFSAMKDELLQAGAKSVFSPTLVVPESFTYEDAMLYALSGLCECRLPGSKPFFDTLICLDGWRSSDAAKLERKVAKACGIPCYELVEVGSKEYVVV